MMKRMRKILAAVAVAAVGCSSGMIASANPAYDRDYRFTIVSAGVGYNSPSVPKLAGTTCAWVYQHDIGGPDVTLETGTNFIVIRKDNGIQISAPVGLCKGNSKFANYYVGGISYAPYAGDVILRANSGRGNYTITGTWNPNITR